MLQTIKKIIVFGRNNESTRLGWLKSQLASIPAGYRVLDAGAGQQRNRQFCQHLRYVSQDFCQYEGKGDGKALQTGTWNTTEIDIVSDITTIPLSDRSFDVVLCTEVLEHVPDPVKAVAELARIVNDQGKLIITAPFASLTHFAPYHFSSGLTSYWYKHHLEKLGFEIECTQHNGGWFDFLAQELWRLPWMGDQYSNRFLGYTALIFALPLILLLKFMRSSDTMSSELLTFGWFIVAKRHPQQR